MQLIQTVASIFLAPTALAQTFSAFTDDDGIAFWQKTWSTGIGDGNAQFGMALPLANASDYTDEYIGRLVATIPEGGTWMGLAHTSGMTNSLILLTWINGEEVMSSFRYASGYVEPDVYTGNASLSVISSFVNGTHYGLTYRCKDCWRWEQDGASGAQVPKTTSAAAQLMGWAQATQAPTNSEQADARIVQHASANIFAATVASARNAAYTSWISLATATATTTSNSSSPTGTGTSGGNSTASATATSTAAVCANNTSITSQTWDYIVVGSGAGGIPIADKLSESGAAVLLIEKGPPSSGRWGGTMRPAWLEGSNLTRFDVPGLDNEIWVDSAGIACTDVGVMAGCVVGGGTAVNAGLWWKANPSDFDVDFPKGWKSSDMEAAIERTFERVPFTACPSMDDIIYQPEGYNVVAGALAASGWDNVTADLVPAQKNFTFSRPNHMFSNGERGGPMATYLVSASERENFKLITNTSVSRVVRDGSTASGVEVEAFLDGGLCGMIKAKNIVLSAGAFGTPKILFRSGIGPQDQLEIVKSAESSSMIDSTQWINLPVGEGLNDHTSTDIVITHPNVTMYDFYAAYDDPIQSDVEKYLDSRSGILAQSAPNLVANFWQEIKGADGVTRQLQYTARVETSHDVVSDSAITITQYLGRGQTGRGKATINKGLNMAVSEVPYLQDEYDLAAVKAGLQSLLSALGADPSISIKYPSSNQTLDDFLANYPVTTSARTANHWMGTCKMGADSGLDNGTSVVDLDTKVYGMENLFVVDASIFPGMTSTNPSALIVNVAEHASEKILALGGGSVKGNSTT
ncbi:hypothetical protein AC578_9541 [Pseudocercospora eumusae]|uniref:Glucose-methanol-choline oxidoreductase N-terminal domain-containing protein n=1 Tax=Pseudocercospora eumusae TaxID=321146 RepID=A0A139HG69_9PEZI|nr:hypothetical protein AC578_9541 [Pseudocercospora eumusae]